MNRRTLIAALTSVAAFSLAAAAAAQTPDDYPNRPIRIIVPQAAGSGVDQQARVLAQKMGELWGQQGVVENRPGANAIIGMEAGAKAAPDGYTLIYAPVSAVAMNAFIYKKLSYDPLRDFVPITQTVANPLGAVVNPGVGHQVDQGYCRAGEGESRSAQLRLVRHRQHDPSDGRAAVDRRRYQDDARALSGADAGDHRRAERTDSARIHDHGRRDRSRGIGKAQSARHVRPRSAMSSSPTRRPRPKFGYPSVVVVGWAGLLAPAGTPPHIINRLHGGMAKALACPTSRTRYCGRARRR